MVSNHITTWPNRTITTSGTGQWFPGQVVQQWPYQQAPIPPSWYVMGGEDHSKKLVRVMDYEVRPADPSRLREPDGGIKHNPTHLWFIFEWDMPYPSYDALHLWKRMLGYWVKRMIDDESGSSVVMRSAGMPIASPPLNDPIAERKASEEYFRVQMEMMQAQRDIAAREAERRNEQKKYEELLRLNNSDYPLKPEEGFWHRILSGIGIR